MNIRPSRKASFVVLPALVAGCCTLKQHKLEFATEAAVIVLMAIDGLETSAIAAQCKETNPILGSCGQRVPVTFYFPFIMAGHAAGTFVMPQEYRPWWIGTALGLEIATVWNSFQLGWRP